MEYSQVPVASLVGIIFSLVVSVGFPIVLLLVVRNKTKTNMRGFATGAITFVIAAMLLERICHMIVFQFAGEAIQNNIVLYALYGGIAAAVFEETGRLIAMKKLMKTQLDFPTALTYGIGHGGIEAILVTGSMYINNLTAALMINRGELESMLTGVEEGMRETAVQSLSALWTMPSYQFFMGGIERVSAVILHIGLSFLIYRALKNRDKKFYFIAMALHFVANFMTVLCVQVIGVIVTEALLLVFVLAVAYFAFKSVKTLI